MANEFYTPSGTPAQSADGNSGDMRLEFTRLQQAFDKMPSLTGHANEEVVINATATGFTTKVPAVPQAADIPFRNVLINGDFPIWQRGTSIVATSGVYLADKWCFVSGGAISATVSRQAFQSATYATNPVTGDPKYFHRAIVSNPAVIGNPVAFAKTVQPIEGAETLQNKAVTVSFWAKADSSKPIAVNLTQVFGGSTVSDVSLGGIKFTLSTTWTKYTATFNLPSVAGKSFVANSNYLALAIWYSAGSSFNPQTNSLGLQIGTFDIARVQLEEGSLSSNFEVRPLALEESLCYRTYESTTGDGGLSLVVVNSGFISQPFKSTKRIAPSMTCTPNSGSGVVLTGTVNGFYQSTVNSVTSGATWVANSEYQGLY